MLLLDTIEDITDTTILCRTTIRPDCVFAIDGRVHASAMIEFVAQACAVLVGARHSDKAGPRLGVIMGCREVTFAVDSFAVGDVLTIGASKIFGEHALAVFTGAVIRDGVQCATVQMSVADASFTQKEGASES
jgi:predicted hotdog family 3-hydroxylacyl-ACP dehydratase